MFRKLWFHNAALVAVALSVLLLFAAGCGSTGHGKLEEGKFNVVTSFYPLYYLAQQIGGQQANVINLVPAGVSRMIGVPRAGIWTRPPRRSYFYIMGLDWKAG